MIYMLGAFSQVVPRHVFMHNDFDGVIRTFGRR
jgi:hypothetical protein